MDKVNSTNVGDVTVILIDRLVKDIEARLGAFDVEEETTIALGH